MMKSINDLFDQEKWSQARTILMKKLKSYPDDHWLLTKIGETFYEEKAYKEALDYSKKALKFSPDCPLVIWDYAGTLDMLNQKNEAIALWKKLLAPDVNNLAYGDHGEGLRWAQSLLNDCRFRIGVSYLEIGDNKQGKKYLASHMKNRRRGLPSLYNIKYVRTNL